MARSVFLSPLHRLFLLGLSFLSIGLVATPLRGQTAPSITGVSPTSGAVGHP